MDSTGYNGQLPPYDGIHSHSNNDPIHNQQYFVDGSMDGPSNNFQQQQYQNQQQPPPPQQQQQHHEQHRAAPLTNDPSFDILDWHPAYQSCQRYFLDHAQHEPATQALCALINIRLPFQWLGAPITTATPPSAANPAQSSSNYSFSPYQTRNSSHNLPSPNRSREGPRSAPPTFVSLVPYIRRLVITGFDKPPILHGFFGDDYGRGVLPHLDCERRNYLFAAKHGGWRSCKKQYDLGSGGGGDESVPFMKPLDAVKMEELTAAEKAWSGWLAMEDWMVGPNAPSSVSGSQGTGRVAATDVQHQDAMADGLPDGVGEAFGSH